MKKFSVYLNLLLLALLAVITWRENYIPRLWQKIFPDNSLGHYLERPAYQRQLARYAVYSKKGGVVMLGTSLTQDIDWNELLNRGDMLNRGYGGDITAVLASRLSQVLAVQPKICFVETGINDIDTGVPQETTVQLLSAITDTLLQHGIVPVLTAVTHVSSTAHHQQERNEKIRRLNAAVYALAKQKSLTVVDNNPVLAPQGLLLPAYASTDGLHYLPAAYLVWKAGIEKVLTEKGL